MGYSYPAIFTKESDGKYDVVFPDLENCYTCGDDYADAIRMAKDVLAFTLYDYERNRQEIPVPASACMENLHGAQMVRIITCDTGNYRKRSIRRYALNHEKAKPHYE